MKIVKYSKSYNNLLSIKKDFYSENKNNLKSIIKINSKYIKQPKRNFCKNCEAKIQKKLFFQFKVNYTICEKCGHLNGLNEDTKKFVNWLYAGNKGSNFKKNYLNDFNKRVLNIYLPKVDFLKKVIKSKINLLDIGSGGGHFLKALELKRVKAIGYEPNKSLVELGNKKLKKNKLINLKLEDTYQKVLKDRNSNVLSMIGVLEHLDKPNRMLNFFKQSKIKYLYICVPLFSLSVLLENSFKNIFPRQLSAGHTHLYTKNSLSFLAKKNNLKIIGEWWFGADFPDLYRSLLNSSSNYDVKKYKRLVDKNLYSVVNELQNVLDKNKICSEVHMIFKKK